MADAVERPATPRLARALWRLGLVAAFIGNVTPLSGVLYWQWDTFQLPMLYWPLVFLVVASGVVFLIDDAERQRQPMVKAHAFASTAPLVIVIAWRSCSKVGDKDRMTTIDT